jgi:flagella basal body P-ring formation protein FlgA
MNTTRSSHRLERRLFLTAAIIVLFPVFAAMASAREPAPQRHIDPADIDSAVAAFTGHAIGEVGGARMRADRRLRLAVCGAPLDLAWHGQSQTTVRVSCPGPDPWQIFVATRSAAPAARAAPAVRRGDPVTILVRGRGFTVQQSGEAVEGGSIGDWIAVRTARRADPIRARIERPGLAIVPVN